LDSAKTVGKRLFPMIALIPILLIIYGLFVIQKINCNLNNDVCPSEVQTVVNRLLGTNTLFVNQKELLTFLKAVYPIDKMTVGYKAFNTLNINLTGTGPYIQADVYLVSKLPALSMDEAPSTTDSAGWWVKPTGELANFISTQEALGFNLWENGSMTPIATKGAGISFIFTEKPTPQTVTSIYNMVKIIHKYLDVSSIYIVDHRSFLSLSGQPDIIIGVPFNEVSLVPALQSIGYLVTIKKDAKVIDFSFKNPIIR
jgi:hypothetical protein